MEARVPNRPSRREKAGIFFVLWSLFATWALATPLFGAPDEPAHTVRAASVARGEILGADVPGAEDAYTAVRAPGIYDDMTERIKCWVRHPAATPSCTDGFDGRSEVIDTRTHVGRYNPVYYAVVGLPSRASTDATGVYLMRLVSAAVAAAFFSLAVFAALRARVPALLLIGIALSLTPMVSFLAGSINPNGMEIAAAACAWVAGLVALETRFADRTVTAWAVMGAVGLLMSRSLSPIWLGLIVILQVVAVSPLTMRSLLAERRWRLPALIVGAATVAAVAWTLAANASALIPVGRPVEGDTGHALLEVLGENEEFLRHMVGVLQWLDVALPSASYIIWAVAVGAIALLGMAAGSKRARLAIGGCMALTILSPLLQMPTIHETGLIWQGRYSLPLAIGVPILAGYALSNAGVDVVAVGRRLSKGLVIGLMIALVAAFYYTGQRNAVGADGPLLFIGREDWTPPIPFAALLLAHVGCLGILARLYFAQARIEPRNELAVTGTVRPVEDLEPVTSVR